MRALVFVYPIDIDLKQFQFKKDDYIIAVDQAYNDLEKLNIHVDLLVGDLDSIDKSLDLSQVNTYKLNEEKDETDSYIALKQAYERTNDVLMIGGLGGRRIEHFYAHTRLFDKFPSLTIKNAYTTIYTLHKGVYKIKSDHYISIFAYEDAIITLKNFKYELNKYKMNIYDTIGISNETKGQSIIEVHKGKVLIFESKK
jgi:thiamine pyrophosphokinase